MGQLSSGWEWTCRTRSIPNVCRAEAVFPLSGARMPLMFALYLVILWKRSGEQLTSVLSWSWVGLGAPSAMASGSSFDLPRLTLARPSVSSTIMMRPQSPLVCALIAVRTACMITHDQLQPILLAFVTCSFTGSRP